MENNVMIHAHLLPVPVELSKQEAANDSQAIIESVESGNVTALDAITKLAYIADVCKQARDGIKEYAISEAQDYAKGEVIKVNGAEVQLSNKSEYDFSNDEEWHLLSDRIETLKKALKDRETFLKALKKPIEVTDTETGEIKTIHPPVKLSEAIVKVML